MLEVVIENEIKKGYAKEAMMKAIVGSGLNSKKSVVRCVVAKNVSSKPRSFFDNLDKGAKTEGASGGNHPRYGAD